jgi:hypothetical protein
MTYNPEYKLSNQLKNLSNDFSINKKYKELITKNDDIQTIIQQTDILDYYIYNLHTNKFIPTLDTINECSILNKYSKHSKQSSNIYTPYYNNLIKHLTIYKKNDCIFVENITNIIPPLMSLVLKKSSIAICKYFDNGISIRSPYVSYEYKLKEIKKIINKFYCYVYTCDKELETYKWKHDLLNITIECKNYLDNNFDFIIHYPIVSKGETVIRTYSVCKRIKQIRTRSKLFISKSNSSLTKTILHDIYYIIKTNPVITRLLINYSIYAKEIALYILSIIKCNNELYYKFVLFTGDYKCGDLFKLLNNVELEFNYEILDSVLNNKNYIF